jgi:hypothetical protein
VDGSATIGPAVLLNVASPVAPSWATIGSPTLRHEKPSSSERWT